MESYTKIVLPADYNYVAAFLTFACQLRCPYCINHHGGDLVKGRRMSGQEWVEGLNRLSLPPDLPITLQGGEPTVHKDFVAIVNGIKPELNLNVLTNFEMPLEQWLYKIDPSRFTHNGLYAPIRISWHRGQHPLKELLERTLEAQRRGYKVGIWAVNHPEHKDEILRAQVTALNMGIDFRLKEFLGPHKGEVYGTFKYPQAVDSTDLRYCECTTSELLIAPDGAIYRCHSDLYAARIPIGHILSERNPLVGQWLPCSVYGKCNSCDIKVKHNRFQQTGHSSVSIRSITEPHAPNVEFRAEVVNTYGKNDITTPNSGGRKSAS